MKILNLVLFSDDKYYHEMYEISSVYNKKFENVKTIYYKYSSEIKQKFELIDDILHIKSDTDTFIPGILNKTISAFGYVYEYVNTQEYDYIIRSNISTIIDYTALIEELSKNPVKFYGGGDVGNLSLLAPEYGILDDRWFGTLYAAGTSIILTNDSLKFIINNKDKLVYDVIDDVAFGIIMKQHNIVVKNLKKQYSLPSYIRDNIFYYDILKKNILENNFIFYKHKVFAEHSKDRSVDIFHMKHTIKILEEKNL